MKGIAPLGNAAQDAFAFLELVLPEITLGRAVQAKIYFLGLYSGVPANLTEGVSLRVGTTYLLPCSQIAALSHPGKKPSWTSGLCTCLCRHDMKQLSKKDKKPVIFYCCD